MKKALACILTLSYLLCCALPVSAEEPLQVVDEAELNAIIESCLADCEKTETNFGLAFYYTATDETYYYQGENHFYSASLFKLPLCMRYAERIADGELDWETKYDGMTVDYLVQRSLVYSDNNAAGVLFYRDKDMLYGDSPFSLYSDFMEEELAQMREEYDFTPRFMLNTLKNLYNQPERFPRIVDYMKEACPEDFFRGILGDRYEIAQKYGQFEGVLHTAGIIYTPTPVMLVVMCDHMRGQREAIERLAEAMADYSLTLDERRAEIERQEAECLKALETPTPTEQPEPTPPPSVQEAPSRDKGMLPICLCLGASVLLSCCAALLKKKR